MPRAVVSDQQTGDVRELEGFEGRVVGVCADLGVLGCAYYYFWGKLGGICGIGRTRTSIPLRQMTRCVSVFESLNSALKTCTVGDRKEASVAGEWR